MIVVAIFDVNGLKEVNDKLGHASGDEVVKRSRHLQFGACMEAMENAIGQVEMSL